MAARTRLVMFAYYLLDNASIELSSSSDCDTLLREILYLFLAFPYTPACGRS